MKKVEIEIPKEFMFKKLLKDLQEDEVICPECKGTGLRISDNEYGLGEKGKELFPYKHQSISFCQHCYNGIQHVCEFCGKNLGRNTTCDCEGFNKVKEDKYIQKEQERFEKAKKMSYEEYLKEYPDYMIYNEQSDKFYTELEDLIDECKSDRIELPKYVYGTDKSSICIDYDNIIEDSCDDLFEEAEYRLIGEDELKSAISKFNEINEEGTTTYYPNYRVAIVL